MRRKSERTASKKTKPSPEKKEKVEKTKHSRSKRRKQSSSSASEAEEPPASVEVTESVEVKATEPPKSANEESSKESQDQVWQVKSTESSGDVGEIQKLKLCLARPSSTPERVDRSPRSKRKHTRATSSSDTQSVEGEEKKKSRRHSKRSDASKDLDNKNDESQNEETELDIKEASPQKSSETKIDQSSDQNKSNDETPASTTNEEIKSDKEEPSETDKTEDTTEEDNTAETETSQDTKVTDKPSDTEAVTTSTSDSESAFPNKAVPTSPDKAVPTSPNKAVTTSPNKAVTTSPNKAVTTSPNKAVTTSTNKEVPTSNEEVPTSPNKTVPTSPKSDDKEQKVSLPSAESPIRKRSLSAEKSEILELHAEESRCESSEVSFSESQDARSKTALEEEDKDVSSFDPGEVSINKSTTEISGQPGSNSEDKITTDNIEDSHKSDEKESTPPDSTQDDAAKDMETARASLGNKEENSQPTPDIPNGEVTPLVANRKRRWGSRPSKLSTQKSITISTDVLKEIIPDVKPAEFDEVIEEKKHKRIEVPEKIDRPILPKIIIDNTENANNENNKRERKVEDKDKENVKAKDSNLASSRKISIVKEQDSIIARPPSPPRHKQSSILYITNLVRPFTLPQLKNLLQRTGKIVENGFWIDRIKSKCYVKYDTEDQAVETRHALHGVTWPVSNPKTLHVDFSTQEDFDKAKANEDTDNAKASTIPGTVEDWLREQDMKREKGEMEKPWERKAAMREWDVGKNEKTKEVIRPDKNHRDERPPDKRRHRSIERSPEPARKFKKKEEEAPAKLLDDLFRKTKATPCIYWLPLSAETIAIKEEQRRQHMAEHERRLQELRRTQRRH